MSYIKSKDSNVVPFEQDGSFYYKKAQKFLNSNDYIEALNYYRKAVEKDPDNVEYLLELAELFTEMNFFDESNRILVRLIHRLDRQAARAYFDMGCNFLGLQDYEQAKEYFNKYLNMEPYGDYVDEAEDFMDILELQTSYVEGVMGFDDKLKVFYNRAKLGKELLDKGEYKKAINIFEQIIKEDPTLLFVKNNLSLAYFCIGDVEKAISIEKEVLTLHNDNVHANCNIALYYDEMGEADERDRYLQKVMGMIDPDDPDNLYKIGVTLCELRHHEDALNVLKMLLDYNPYDVKIIYYCGIAYLNMQRYSEAMECWDKILKLDPDNSIATFYRNRTHLHMRQLIPAEQYGYQYQVPHQEFIRRIRFINDLLAFKPSKLLDMWQSDGEFYSMIKWGLELNDDAIKGALLHIVAGFKDEKAEKLLRDFLLKKDESESLRKEVFALLKQNGVKEPYLAYMDQKLVEVKVNLIADDTKYAVYREAAELAIKEMGGRYEGDYADYVRGIMERYLRIVPADHLINVRRKEIWAAALEYFYCKDNGITMRMQDLAQYYDVALTSLSNAYRRLADALLYSAY